MKSIVIASLVLVAVMDVAAAQDMAAGEASYRKCQFCHDVGEDAKNKLGAALNGLDGRKAGSVEGVSYSAGMKSSGITWNADTFKEYVKDPRGKVSGTSMLFPGIKDDKEIDDLWAYLKQFGPDGKKK